MKLFLIKLFFLCSLVLAIFLLLLSNADGYTDSFYKRFTTKKQDNLILGTSRGAQGLQPIIFQEILAKNILNYSFTLKQSPFGPVYLNSIKKKLNSDTKDGIFIVTVDPWSISSNTKNTNDVDNFEENSLCLGNTSIVNMNPNFEYLLKNLSGKYYTVICPSTNSFLHDDGWLEITIPMDSFSISKRLEKKINDYRINNLPFFHFSTLRLDYLKKTIELLKLHGKVYMVRLPIHPKMFEIELKLLPEFNKIISPIAKMTNGYLDMSNENNCFQYTDGNHLYKKSGQLVSKKIAEWIKSKRYQ
jgi:hypothetical protein